jgi:proline iminopeptidase
MDVVHAAGRPGSTRRGLASCLRLAALSCGIAVAAPAVGCAGATAGAAHEHPVTTAPPEQASGDFEGDSTTGDSSTHFWSHGGSPTSRGLVLINGGPGISHESMDPLQEALASADWQVVTYDQRGVGRSVATGTGAFAPDDYVADLEALRRRLGKERLHLLGHSFGGMIALRYLDRHPDRVASLTLVDPGVADPDAMRKGGEAIGRRIAELQREGIVPDPIPPSSCRDRILAAMPAYFANPRLPLPAPLLRRTCDGSGRSSVLDAFMREPYTPAVGEATLPALVIFGASDPLRPASVAAAAALAHARLTQVELPDCGHLGWLECPRPFLDAVRRFLAGLPAGT